MRHYDLASMELLGVSEVRKPDNLSWNSAGKLLCASHCATVLGMMAQTPGEGEGPSPVCFSIVEIDPETMQTRTLLQRQGAPMGAGTVAVEAAGHLYIGSYVGDRLIKVPLEQLL